MVVVVVWLEEWDTTSRFPLLSIVKLKSVTGTVGIFVEFVFVKRIKFKFDAALDAINWGDEFKLTHNDIANAPLLSATLFGIATVVGDGCMMGCDSDTT